MATDTAAATLPRPTEKVAIVSLVLVFLCGVALGAVVMSVSGHAGLHATAHGAAPVAAGLSMSVTEWKQQLDLTDDQTVQLTSILDDFSHYYDNVLADGNSRIVQILKPEQRRKFEQMLKNHKR
jgi:Spy/CpxP family protein refolding chaperone